LVNSGNLFTCSQVCKPSFRDGGKNTFLGGKSFVFISLTPLLPG